MNGEHDFDQWLQREMTRKAEYLEDAGFTDRVMAAVPARRRSRRAAALAWTLLLALGAGALALAAVRVAGWQWVYVLAEAFAGLSLLTLLQGGLVMTLLLAVGTGWLLWREA